MWQDDVVDCARTWFGTKYFFGQLVKGVGADCGTFIIGVFREVGLCPKTLELTRKYNRQASQNVIESIFNKELIATGLFEKVWSTMKDGYPPKMEKGDLLVFKNPSRGDGHIAIYTGEGTIIHCTERGGVEEIKVSKQNVSSVWRYKG